MAYLFSFLSDGKDLTKTLVSTGATIMVFHSVINELIPTRIRRFFCAVLDHLIHRYFSSQFTLVIHQFHRLNNNLIYDAALTYLSPKISPSTRRRNVLRSEKEKSLTFSLEPDEEIHDFFNGAKLKWILICQDADFPIRSSRNRRDHHHQDQITPKNRYLELTFQKHHREMVENSYLPFILERAKIMKQEVKTQKIFTIDHGNLYGNPSDTWMPTNLDHPATFETVALDPEIKKFVLDDLDKFVRRKEYYRKIGKAWKRGYLMYGPPGTGKSSLIAAMANYLNFDIYDLDLSEIEFNSELRRLLLGVGNRSIIVVEDIDCVIEFKDRNAKTEPSNSKTSDDDNNKQVTLSGLLNFVDGLWSCCGEERIVVFTTNHKEKLDPALLRPGRMDVHLHLSYCTPPVFRQLAANYLSVQDHSLFPEIEDAIGSIHVTPAQIAEQLLHYSNDVDITLKELVNFLKKKKNNKEDKGELQVEKKQEEEHWKHKVDGDDNKQEDDNNDKKN
ncbi:protein HYPER-SENSITIVITY-RELATED 4-like [Senna tora]|uniref:Protein HYPER-SENSITIVITY-RELATED 4-like n=1 Tax=Senna tora TaxID=362788 RepID=A0A834SV16_9FABA|nr:protein HYPER-SENSITIVITY-RELATED 4-like [Senna tora]